MFKAKTQRRNNRLTSLTICLLLLVCLRLPALHSARTLQIQVYQDATSLKVGQVIERTMKGGERHGYQVELVDGQFLHAVVEQRGIDVKVSLFAPDGQKLLEVDAPTGVQGPEHVLLIASATGTYRIEINALEKAAAGAYAAHIEAQRIP